MGQPPPSLPPASSPPRALPGSGFGEAAGTSPGAARRRARPAGQHRRSPGSHRLTDPRSASGKGPKQLRARAGPGPPRRGLWSRRRFRGEGPAPAPNRRRPAGFLTSGPGPVPQLGPAARRGRARGRRSGGDGGTDDTRWRRRQRRGQPRRGLPAHRRAGARPPPWRRWTWSHR